ncbi:MAG TPA: ion channel [Aestuariivirga sp.]
MARKSHNKKPRQRTIHLGDRDIRTIGGETEFWSDMYHRAMTASFGWFLFSTLAMFIGVNLFFAVLYAMDTASVGRLDEPHFLNLFFFSIEAFTTVGFGEMYPITTWSHLVYSIEGFIALLFTAALTGVIFARFSRPRARILFAANPVVAQHDGKTHFMLRIANARHNYIADANAQLWLIRIEPSKEGQRFRRFHELKLGRNQNPAFILSWTLFHVIDSSSKLYGLTADELAKDDYQFIVTMRGMDATASQELRTRKSYTHDQVLWGRRYTDILTTDEAGLTTLDYSKFHETTPE